MKRRLNKPFSILIKAKVKKTRVKNRNKPHPIILKQTYFIDTESGLIDYTASRDSIVEQALFLYGDTMYTNPEAAAEFVGIAHEYCDNEAFKAALEQLHSATTRYLLTCPKFLPKETLSVNPRKLLTNSAYRVYKMMGEGYTYGEIARELGRTIGGVKIQIYKFMKILNIKSIKQVRLHANVVGGIPSVRK